LGTLSINLISMSNFPNSLSGNGLEYTLSIPHYIAFSTYSFSTWPVIAMILG